MINTRKYLTTTILLFSMQILFLNVSIKACENKGPSNNNTNVPSCLSSFFDGCENILKHVAYSIGHRQYEDAPEELDDIKIKPFIKQTGKVIKTFCLDIHDFCKDLHAPYIPETK
ncbi:hypothetical protein KAH94_01510 [bacterium]|nr:hypothetical protein [bacterium]